MAWMGLSLKGGKRRSVGGSEHQASLREALRNRGGAQALVTPVPSDREDDADGEKAGLDWLDLTAFAPTALHGAIKKLRADVGSSAVVCKMTGVPMAPKVDEATRGSQHPWERGNFGGQNPPAAKKGSKSRRSTGSDNSLRAALQARGGATLPVKQEETEKAQAGSDPKVLARLEKVAEALACISNSPGSTLSSVMEEKGDDIADQEFEPIKSMHPCSKIAEEAVEDDARDELAGGGAVAAPDKGALRSDVEEDGARTLDEAAVQNSSQPAADGAQFLDGTSTDRPARPAEAGEEAQADVGTAIEQAAANSDSLPGTEATEETGPDRVGEAVPSPPAAEPPAVPACTPEEDATAAVAEEVACPEIPVVEETRPVPEPADAAADEARRRAEEEEEAKKKALAEVAAEEEAKAEAARQAHAERIKRLEALVAAQQAKIQQLEDPTAESEPPKPAATTVNASKELPKSMQDVKLKSIHEGPRAVEAGGANATASGTRSQAPVQMTSKPKEAAPSVVDEVPVTRLQSSPAPSKHKDLRQFWGKNSVGFAGPTLGTNKRLSKCEAQATLQRLIQVGGAVDFDEVRRLRKLIAELD